MSNNRKRYHYDEEEWTDPSERGTNSYLLLAAISPIVLQVAILCTLIFILTYYYSKANSCVNNREIWCKDDWYCNKQTASTDKTCSRCYQKRDHLASCLFGPDSDAAVKCIDYTKKGVACPCVVSAGSDTAKGGSCLAGCPSALSKTSKTTVCCCQPGTPGCTNTVLPPECSS